MVEAGHNLGLAFETTQTIRIARQLVGEDLDRHLAIELGIGGLPDHAHPALADLLDQAVVRQSLTRLRHILECSDCAPQFTPEPSRKMKQGCGATLDRPRETQSKFGAKH
jgi:hypothetical protein